MRLLKSSNQLTAYSSYTIDLKVGRMLLVISQYNRLESDFSISPEGAVGARLLRSSNRFTAYSYPIDRKLDRFIQVISPHNPSIRFFIILPGRAV